MHDSKCETLIRRRRATRFLGHWWSSVVVARENVGLLGLTRVGSRRVVQISAGFMIFFGIFGKFGAVFASIPLPIFAAIYCILFGIVAAVGISFIQFANNSMRNLYVIGISLFLGVSIPQYFNEYTTNAEHGPAHSKAGWFNDVLNSVFSSAPAVCQMLASAGSVLPQPSLPSLAVASSGSAERDWSSSINEITITVEAR